MKSILTKNKIRLFALLLFLLALFASVIICVEKDSEAISGSDGLDISISAYYPQNNSSVSITNKTVAAWRSKYKTGSSVKYANKKEKTRPKAVTLKWKYKGNNKLKYTVHIADSSGQGKVLKYSITGRTLKIYNLEGHKSYEWWITAKDGSVSLKSNTSIFRTSSYPRTLKIGGVYNIRDIGGAKTKSGKRVREGLIYRSANLNKVTKSGKKILREDLGIKTDLDLRRPGEGGAGKKSAAGLRYINISSKAYEGTYQKKSGRNALVRSMKVFTKKKNYPVLFHCVAGRDRTGTLAMVLEGVLGMKKKDIFRDYELTYLSKHSNDPSYAKRQLKRFKKAYSYFAGYKDSSRSFEYNVTSYLRDNGMTRAEIKAIKSIMLK